MQESQTKQINELTEYVFRRIKHPAIDVITEDSIRNALNVNDIKGVDDQVVMKMIAMAKSAGSNEHMKAEDSSESDEDFISKEEFSQLFKKLKLKIDAEGRCR